MISLFNIKTVARFESKTLLRSWFFRIFAAIIILFITFFNLFGLTSVADGSWPGRLLPSGGIYFNMWILNIAQAIIAVFLSADFLGRDKKLDTTEAFYVRSMTNTEYVLGKTIGILKVFVILNLFVLFSATLFTLIGNEVSLPWVSILIYPLLISLPTLVFILGLSFFVMTLVRNQAITFVLLLGYIALSMFYLQTKWFGLTDFLGFYTSFMRSDFSGFANIIELVSLRGSYLLLGLFFILATVWRLPRLEQQKMQKLKLSIGLSLLLVGSLFLLGVKVSGDLQQQNLRTLVRDLNEGLSPSSYQIVSYKMDLDHRGETLVCEVVMDIERDNVDNADLVLALNPGLVVNSISANNEQSNFKQEGHLLTIKTDNISSSPFMLQIIYEGSIKDEVMYPEIEDEIWNAERRTDPLLASKQYSFVLPNYVVLTREANWYPVVASQAYWTQYPFTKMNLKVKTNPQLKVITQGLRDSISDGTYAFEPEHALNAHSLVIGDYEHHSLVIDSVEFNLYHHKEHNFYKECFTEVTDTVPLIIKTIKDDFERKLGLTYPYKRFSLVESSINLHSYMRNWSLATENNMPEMVLFAENGGGVWQNDLPSQKGRIERRSKRSNEEVTEKEQQVDLLKSYLGDNFISPSRFFFGRRQESERSVENWGRYQIFPNYFSYSTNVVEDGYPLLTIALENYYHQRLSEARRRGLGGLSSNDEVILKLRQNSLQELINKEDVNSLGNVFASKGNQLFSNLKVNMQQSNFDKELDHLLIGKRFNNLLLDDFTADISALANLEFNNVYNNWLNEASQAAFMFGSVDVHEVKEGNRIRYFVKIPLVNNGTSDGIIGFTIREGAPRGRGGRFRSRFDAGAEQQDNVQSYLIKAGETSEIGFLLDQEPREILVNTYLASNIPSSQTLSINKVIRDKRKVEFFEGQQASNAKISYKEAFEIIVDNEDEGFSIVNTGESRTVKDWWASMQNEEEESDTYGMIQFWNPPVKWKPVAGDQFFGEYLKSAYYKRKGSGEGYLTWTANIENTGAYEVQAFVPNVNFRRGRGRGRSNDKDKEYTFKVYHDDGEDEVKILVNRNNAGWIYLGNFYFSEGNAQVKLFDISNTEYVIGDAIKWTKK